MSRDYHFGPETEIAKNFDDSHTDHRTSMIELADLF